MGTHRGEPIHPAPAARRLALGGLALLVAVGTVRQAGAASFAIGTVTAARTAACLAPQACLPPGDCSHPQRVCAPPGVEGQVHVTVAVSGVAPAPRATVRGSVTVPTFCHWDEVDPEMFCGDSWPPATRSFSVTADASGRFAVGVGPFRYDAGIAPMGACHDLAVTATAASGTWTVSRSSTRTVCA